MADRIPKPTFVADSRIEWDLDRIVRNGSTVKVEPRHMRVLSYLVARPGAVVSREELLGEAWPDVIVEDEALTQSISVLRRALGDAARNPAVIQTVPKKGYRLIAPVSSALPEPASARRPELVEMPADSRRPEPQGTDRKPGSRRLAAAGLAAVLVAAVLRALSADPAQTGALPSDPLEAVAVTTFEGREAEPALSPDGRTLAFVWNGPDHGRFDLWVKRIGSEAPRRLTDTAELETGPAWSPDGGSIAFARVGEGTCGIFILSLADREERRLSSCGAHAFPQIAYSPDGGSLVVSDSDAPAGRYRLSLLSLASRERRDLTRLVAGHGDRSPAFSADGRRVAFVRRTGMGAADLYVVATGGGEPRRLTRDGGWFGGVTWSPGSRSLIASSSRSGGGGLWRVPLDGTEPRWLGVREEGAVRPAVAHGPGSLVFERQDFDSDIWRLEPAGERPSEPVVASTRRDGAPRFSPDGRRLAFVSDRSGHHELWVSGADGAAPRRLSDLRSARMLSPRWAPDGRSLVVAADRDGQGDLFLVPLSARQPGDGTRRLAPSDANEVAPAFAADGRAVFFMSDRDGCWRLWAVRLDSGHLRPVVDLPLSTVFPAADGRSLYASRFDRDGVWRIPLDGGGPELVVASLSAGDWGNWSARGAILDLVVRRGERATLERLDTRTGRAESLGRLPISGDDQGIAVSPDGGTVLFTLWDRSESDIFVVSSLR